MYLPCCKSPLQLQRAAIARVVAWEAELLALIADLPTAWEGAILVSCAISGLQYDEFIFIQALAYAHGAVAIHARVTHLPLDEVARARGSHVVDKAFSAAATGWGVDQRVVREAAGLRVY